MSDDLTVARWIPRYVHMQQHLQFLTRCQILFWGLETRDRKTRPKLSTFIDIIIQACGRLLPLVYGCGQTLNGVVSFPKPPLRSDAIHAVPFRVTAYSGFRSPIA